MLTFIWLAHILTHETGRFPRGVGNGERPRAGTREPGCLKGQPMNESEPETEESRGCTDLEVTVCTNGVVNVNRPNGSGRAHSVFVGANGGVLRCSCRGHRFHGHCAHVDEIAARPLVVSIASAASQVVMTDGGKEDDRFLPPEHPEHVPEDEEEDDEQAGHGLSTVTGWASGETTVDEQEVDETPL